MAITFTQEKKKQKYLVLVLAAVILLILLVVWWGFLKGGERIAPTPTTFIPKQVKIEWDVLKQEEVQNLKLFEEIAGLEEGIGRKNPFLPY